MTEWWKLGRACAPLGSGKEELPKLSKGDLQTDGKEIVVVDRVMRRKTLENMTTGTMNGRRGRG